MKAARSASETQLRGKATSSLKGKGKGKGLLRAVTVARVASAVSKAQKASEKDETKPLTVESERVTRSEKPQAPKTVKSERVQKSASSGAKSAPKAIAGPKPTTAPKSKGKKSPKRETTPGYQKVYKATPAVDLNEGPNFGKTTSIIEPTFQPKTPKKKKNA
jgi:hypothetical protein